MKTATLTPVQTRLIEKLKKHGLAIVDTAPTSVRRNPYSGVEKELEPLAAALYDWIVSPKRGDNIANGMEPRGDWDRARMLFLTLWPDEYYDLID